MMKCVVTAYGYAKRQRGYMCKTQVVYVQIQYKTFYPFVARAIASFNISYHDFLTLYTVGMHLFIKTAIWKLCFQ